MSLLPVSTFPGVVFLEARILGQPASIVSQIGLSVDALDCSVAVFSRASGVLLVAGVGSYCAYRICTKFLGRRFVWMLLDNSKYNVIPTADRRLLYSSDLTFSDQIDDNEEDENDYHKEDKLFDIVSGSGSSEISVVHLSRYSRSGRTRGLYAIRQNSSNRDGVLSRQCGRSDRYYHSRNISRSSSNRSASIRIIWEGQQDWEDEFASQPMRAGAHVNHSSISKVNSVSGPVKPIPAVSSVDDLCSIFDDVMSVTSLLDVSNDTIYGDATDDIGDITTNDDLMRIKCMTDSKYMYRSVVVARSEFGSEAGSNYGGSVISNRSNLFDLRKLINKTMEPQGLWDLSQNDPSTDLSKDILKNEMTDSGLSRSTVSKLSQGQYSVLDSAIEIDDVLSEVESTGKSDRTPLRSLNEYECSSQMSLEWFDDELRVRDGAIDAQLSSDRSYSDFEEKQSEFTAVSSIYCPQNSNDLMAFACQKFQPFSSQFAAIQKLYHRRRLKRIGYGKHNGEGNLRLFLCSALYHRCNVILDQTWNALEKRLNSCLSGCDFILKWKGKNEKDGRTENDLRSDLQSLWDASVCPTTPYSSSLLRGLEVLLVLEAKVVYEKKVAGANDLDWFNCNSPVTIMNHLEHQLPINEVLWRLLTRCCDVSIELIDMTSSHMPSVRFGTSPKVLTWLKHSSHPPQPLFYVPDN